MSGKFLLDTNILIAIMREVPEVQARLRAGTEILVPSTALGELYFGAAHSERQQENMKRLDLFASENLIVPCDAGTARLYGQIRAELREQGRPIPNNDIWIAAIARQHDYILATRDAHFDEIENLQTEMW